MGALIGLGPCASVQAWAQSEAAAAALLRRHALPLAGPGDTRPVLAAIGDARTVLLGEATHGTKEFYRLRAEITRRLIRTRAFDAVVVEGDWPAARRADRYAQGGDGGDRDAAQALSGFAGFGNWLWRNTEVRDWLDWLRAHNQGVADPLRRVGFYGFDLRSLGSSAAAVVRYFERVDPAAAERARARYACFEGYAERPERYARAANLDLAPPCRGPAIAQSEELDAGAEPRARDAADALFEARHNARIVRDAEAYYRAGSQGRAAAWNLRDTHMADTLDRLREHLTRQRGRPATIVVWAHNTHVGDARATSSAAEGELSLGQLVRQRAARPEDVALIGLTTHAGTVTAARDRGEPPQRLALRPSLPGSVERLLHDTGLPAFVLPLRDRPALRPALAEPRAHRAVGVVYRPDAERASHYTRTALAEQYDAVVHIDRTQALQVLK